MLLRNKIGYRRLWYEIHCLYNRAVVKFREKRKSIDSIIKDLSSLIVVT